MKAICNIMLFVKIHKECSGGEGTTNLVPEGRRTKRPHITWSQICRTNGTSGQWVIGPPGRRTNEPYSIFGVVCMINGLSNYLIVG